MKGTIPRSFIDDLIARTDIVEVINSRVKLKKAGRDYQACCPFHHEKSPSFSVSQSKQFYHCFGCGVHGNVITFLMDYDKLEFPEAIEELAAMHGLEVPRENVIQRDGKPQANFKTKRNLYELMEAVAKFYQQNLSHQIEPQSYYSKEVCRLRLSNALKSVLLRMPLMQPSVLLGNRRKIFRNCSIRAF